jgi:hypothetical protein
LNGILSGTVSTPVISIAGAIALDYYEISRELAIRNADRRVTLSLARQWWYETRRDRPQRPRENL